MDRFEDAKNRIKERVDLVDLIQDYVALTRRGRLLVACCPFHQEKTPSFTVYQDSQHYKCYGCGTAGDVFSFVMEREGLSFRDAMEQLAERAGVPLEGVFGSGSRRPKTDSSAALGKVASFFASVLAGPEGRAAREYLEMRGLAGAIEPFGLGVHPRRHGALLQFARAEDLPLEVLRQAGLFGRDGRREPFAGRLLFPIADDRGRVCGFGGRILPGDQAEGRPKYLNSPESPSFNKRRILFGLRQVKQAGERQVVVMEGYTDVVACHLAGIRGAVATLGTALTTDHARLLERYATDGVVLLFDGDPAGRRAADRAFRELVHASLPVRIALLEEGTDPADLIGLGGDDGPPGAGAERTDGAARLRSVIDGAEDGLRMWFRLMRRRMDLSVDANVQRAADECARVLGEVENVARQQALRAAMARHLGVTEAALEPKRTRAQKDAAQAPQSVQRNWTPLEQTDLDSCACVLADPRLVERLGELAGPLAEPVDTILGWTREYVDRGVMVRDDLVRALFSRCGEREGAARFLAEAVDRSARIRDARSMFSKLRDSRNVHYARKEARRTRLELEQAMADGDDELTERLTRRYVEQVRPPE